MRYGLILWEAVTRHASEHRCASTMPLTAAGWLLPKVNGWSNDQSFFRSSMNFDRLMTLPSDLNVMTMNAGMSESNHRSRAPRKRRAVRKAGKRHLILQAFRPAASPISAERWLSAFDSRTVRMRHMLRRTLN
jgi:hypothetical protein